MTKARSPWMTVVDQLAAVLDEQYTASGSHSLCSQYQRCYLAEKAAHMLNIELLYLPPYSPNLNLIERAWKFIKKKALANRSFESFQSFQTAINDCIGKFSTDYAQELDTLLTWNFQAF